MDSTDGAVDHELRQTRLSRFGRVLACMTLAYLGLMVFTTVYVGRFAFNRAAVSLLGATVAFAALWLLLRGAPLLTGTHVFGGKSILEVCAHHLHTVPDPPSTRLGAPVTMDLETLLLACLAKRPEDRPASAQVLRGRLRACAAAGRWTNARATQWWRDHRHRLRSGGAETSADADDRAATDARGSHLTVTRIAS